MQAVFDGEVLEVAQPRIDAAQRIVGRGGAADAGLARQSGPLRGLDDQLRQPLAAAAIKPFGLRIFVDQAFKLARVAGKRAGDQRRRQMADRHAGDAALGLRRFARIADDEGIDHRQRAGDDFRKTFRGQRDRFAGQPFQRAVRAHMHERIGLRDVLQPKPERDQRVPRRQRRIVIVGAPFRRAAAIGRQGDDHIAELLCAEAKRAIADIGIVRQARPRLRAAARRLPAVA